MRPRSSSACSPIGTCALTTTNAQGNNKRIGEHIVLRNDGSAYLGVGNHRCNCLINREDKDLHGQSSTARPMPRDAKADKSEASLADAKQKRFPRRQRRTDKGS